MNYALVSCILFFELAVFYIFKVNYGKIFFQIMPLIMIGEISYIPRFSKIFIHVKNCYENKIGFIRACYAPAAVGVFGFIAIGVGMVNQKYIFICGIASSILAFFGKILVFIYKDRLKISL